MIEKDYLLRLIQQFTAVLAKIIFNKKIQNYDQAFVEIDKALNGLLGLTHADALSLPVDRLLQMLRESAGDFSEKCYVLAELLRQDGEISELGHKNQFLARQNYERSLFFYLETLAVDQHFQHAEIHDKMKLLSEKLANDLQYQFGASRVLFRYFETIGEFAQAENLLFRLLENREPDILDQGLAFYQRLAAKSEAELTAGKLNRAELHEGLAALQKYSHDNTKPLKAKTD